MTEETNTEQWAIVELFGHQRIAGRVSEQTLGGCSYLRVDVPETDLPGFTKLYGNGAIYAISFVDKDIATHAARSIQAQPVTTYEMRDAVRLYDQRHSRTELSDMSSNEYGDWSR